MWPEDDFEVWESLQLFDFPQTKKTPEAQPLETGLPLTSALLGAKKHGQLVSVETVDGRGWDVRIRAVGKTWFSGETRNPHRGVIFTAHSVVEFRCGAGAEVDGRALDVSLSRAMSASARHRPAIRITTTKSSRDGIIQELGTDYLTVSRRSLVGQESVVVVPFSQLVAVEFLEPGDIS